MAKELAVTRERVLVLERCRRSPLPLRLNSIVRLPPVGSARSPSRGLLPADLGLMPKVCDEDAFLSCDTLPSGDETGSGLFLGVIGDSSILLK